jgi:hypothetical protein
MLILGRKTIEVYSEEVCRNRKCDEHVFITFRKAEKRFKEERMDNYSIDASLGLAVALELLAMQRLSGELRASISMGVLKKHISQYIIHITDGRVVTCVRIEQPSGEQHFANQKDLIQLDQRKGPFAWSFYPSVPLLPPALVSVPQPPPPSAPVSAVKDNAVLIRLTPSLHLDWIENRSADEQRLLSWIFALVDGQRTVRDVKALLSFAPETVERALMFLVAMHQISVRRRTESEEE